MTEADRRAYVLADNKLALDAGWNVEILALELGELIAMDFEVDLTGFDQPEIDKILCDATEASTVATGPENVHPELPAPSDVVTRSGDLWQFGRHYLLCGDAKDPVALESLMQGAAADMVFIDPPYNVRIAGNV